jgi:choice-of-anchor A domain-containing protein
LLATQTFGSITSSTTIVGNGGLNVIQINGNVNLTSANLLFHGTPSDIFVVNISGSMALTGSGFVSPSGGVYDTRVLLNFTGPGTLTASGTPTVNATILAPNQAANFSGTFGSIYAGGGLTSNFAGGAKIHPTPFVPAPGTVVLLGLGGLIAARRRR